METNYGLQAIERVSVGFEHGISQHGNSGNQLPTYLEKQEFLPNLAKNLSKQIGKSFSKRNLAHIVLFFRTYQFRRQRRRNLCR